MKLLLAIFTLFTLSYAEQYTFLVASYDKEIELEAKIVHQIATASVGKPIKLFIPEITNVEKKIYSHFFTLVDDCNSSNFVFVNKNLNKKSPCEQAEKLFFTNNYQALLSNQKFYGAFFWSKSRPNIVFIKERLAKKSVRLPKEYNRYIEDFDGQ